jgi:hypothetical protein
VIIGIADPVPVLFFELCFLRVVPGLTIPARFLIPGDVVDPDRPAIESNLISDLFVYNFSWQKIYGAFWLPFYVVGRTEKNIARFRMATIAIVFGLM